MTKAECRILKEAQSSNDEGTSSPFFVIRTSCRFVSIGGFVLWIEQSCVPAQKNRTKKHPGDGAKGEVRTERQFG